MALGAAAIPASTWATPPDLDDVSIVRQALDLHPGLYRYQSPRQFAQRFAQFARDWQTGPDRAARFLTLSRLTAQVRCGHTQCNPFNQTDEVVTDLFDRPTRLPFAFRWIGNTMVVISDSGAATGIVRGSVVERLNGRAPTQMLAALLPYARADGSNDAKRRVQMEMRGDDQFETFDIFQGLLFPPVYRAMRCRGASPVERGAVRYCPQSHTPRASRCSRPNRPAISRCGIGKSTRRELRR